MFLRTFIRSVVFFISVFFLWAAVVHEAAATSRETPVVKVVRENANAVVNISTERIVFLRQSPFWGRYDSEFDLFFERFFAPTRALKLKSVGSGVIIDKKGLVVTNAHVINMATNIFVVLNDGTSYEAEVVYENADDDIAFVKITPLKPLKEVKLGNTDDIMIGETVVAIGNPFGLQNSVTVGVVSGENRAFYSSRGEPIFKGLLQTDAPINPGSSGGALLDLEGRMIGLNLAVVQHSQSIGFAIPVEKVKADLEKYRREQSAGVVHRRKSVPSRGASQPGQAFSARGERWDPFVEMQRLHKQMSRMFSDSFMRGYMQGGFENLPHTIGFDPDVDVKEEENAYVVKVDLPGVDKDKIDITARPHSLTISGERTIETEEKDYGGGFYRSERSFGSFSRTIPLPERIDVNKVTAESKQGVLIIRIPKEEQKEGTVQSGIKVRIK